MSGEEAPAGLAVERTTGRIVTAGTYLSVLLISIGVALMVVNGRSPLDPSPPFSLRSIGSEIAAGQARGFLWLGLIAALATAPASVVGSLVGYVRLGDRRMAAISVGILAIIAAAVAISLATGSGG